MRALIPTAAALLWCGAGRPTVPGVVAATGRCWWCASAVAGRGLPVSDLPDTFADRHLAACPGAAALCAACAWSISSSVRLPPELADAGLAKVLARGGRAKVEVRGRPPVRYLVLRLHDGRIGLWSTASRNAGEEQPWDDAVDELRVAPRNVGPCHLVDVVTDGDIGTGTAFFRNYHHLGTARVWRPVPNDAAGKLAIRRWLLDPPAEPWACVIGDGQKQCAMRTPVSDGDACVVGLVGVEVRYAPPALRRWLDAYEDLIAAGADDDAIVSGRYAASGAALALAARRHEPVIDPIRGSARLDLCAFLRRPRKELTHADAAAGT